MTWLSRRSAQQLFGERLPTGKAGKQRIAELVDFIKGMICGNDEECKDWSDFTAFLRSHDFAIKPSHWQAWLAHYDQNQEWAVIEDGKVAYFQQGTRVSEWTNI